MCAWQTPTTRSTSDLITASIWNTDLTDNLIYLKTEMDKAILEDGTNAFTANQPMGNHKLTGLAAGSASGDSVRYNELHNVTQSVVTGSRALDTVYQNTSGKIKLCLVTIVIDMSGGKTWGRAWVKSDSLSPPTTVVADIEIEDATSAAQQKAIPCSFFVSPNNYYKIEKFNSNESIEYWVEYTLH